MGERPDIAGRVAWVYLATVGSGALGGLLALIAYQIVNPLACPIPDGDAADLALSCSLGWAIVLSLVGFAAVFSGALILFKVEARLATWLAMIAGLLWLTVGLAGIGEWWWILLLVLLPALVALASAPWSARWKRLQVAGLAVLLVVGIGLLGYQLTVG